MGNDSDDDRAGSVLVVIGSPPRVDELTGELRRRTAGDGEPVVHVVAPALTETALDHAAGNVDDAVEMAQERVERTVRELRSSFSRVSGGVGDSDPMLAIGDALRTAPFDEIFIVTGESDEHAWLERGSFDRARTEFEPPVTHIELGSEGEVTDLERSGPGVDRDPEAEVDMAAASGAPARFTLRSLLGIAVAIVGTIVLVVLFANCVGAGSVGAACVARGLLAGGLGLINVAHVVGLIMFESADYHGPWERFFALTSLWGTPAAVAVSLLLPA